MNKIIEQLPPMLSGEELIEKLTVLPKYNKNIVNKSSTEKLIELNSLYDIYYPNDMSLEIYSKLYLSLVRSLQKKTSIDAVRQRNENGKAILLKEHNSIIGGSDSFSIIAPSGIGKSTAINRAIEAITNNTTIEIEELHQTIIPCLVVQCPFDSSVKGMLLEILRKVDLYMNTDYHKRACRLHSTIDMLIGSVSQICLNHVGLLVIDEIQNTVKSKSGKNLIGCLTQLINNSGISICLVGTPVSALFFEQEFQLARRSQGLRYEKLQYDESFKKLCCALLKFQYVKESINVDEGLFQWLYEHSGGITSVVVSLIHDAQEIAILNEDAKLNKKHFIKAFETRTNMLHQFLEPENKLPKYTNISIKKEHYEVVEDYDEDVKFLELMTQAKSECIDVIKVLKEKNLLEEVTL